MLRGAKTSDVVRTLLAAGVAVALWLGTSRPWLSPQQPVTPAADTEDAVLSKRAPVDVDYRTLAGAAPPETFPDHPTVFVAREPSDLAQFVQFLRPEDGQVLAGIDLSSEVVLA